MCGKYLWQRCVVKMYGLIYVSLDRWSVFGLEVDMSDFLKGFVDKKGLQKWFRRDNLIIAVLSGVLLLVIAWPMDKGEEAGDADSVLEQTQGSALPGLTQGSDSGDLSEGSLMSGISGGGSKGTEEYRSYLEERLVKLLGSIDGIGKVEVMITLASSEEVVLGKESDITSSDTSEADAQGGTRDVSQWESQESTVVLIAGSDSQPYVIKTLLPRVEGVVVVAQGAGSNLMNKNIGEAVDALFGIGLHKIKVLKMKMDE
jgi:stage III sporulation protein AG